MRPRRGLDMDHWFRQSSNMMMLRTVESIRCRISGCIVMTRTRESFSGKGCWRFPRRTFPEKVGFKLAWHRGIGRTSRPAAPGSNHGGDAHPIIQENYNGAPRLSGPPSALLALISLVGPNNDKTFSTWSNHRLKKFKAFIKHWNTIQFCKSKIIFMQATQNFIKLFIIFQKPFKAS